MFKTDLKMMLYVEAPRGLPHGPRGWVTVVHRGLRVLVPGCLPWTAALMVSEETRLLAVRRPCQGVAGFPLTCQLSLGTLGSLEC